MIRVSGLSYAVGSKPILRNMEFSVEENDFFLIFGPNGAGKSTLLKLLAGILPIRQGCIQIAAKSVARYSRRELARQVAYLPQFDEFNLPMRVWDILMAGRYPYGSIFKNPSCRDHEIVENTIERFALTDAVDRNIQTLSGGERKKVMLASAFVQDVPIVLLDEPLNFLDPASSIQVVKMLKDMHGQGKTILLVSHMIQYFFSQATKMLALKNGEMRFAGSKVFSPQLFQDVYGVTVRQVMAGGREFIHFDE
jgi:iron complex transport system ATP-binding protein